MKKQIDYIMDNFDFSRVHKAMKALNWKWAGANYEVPEESDLRSTARRLLEDVAVMDIGYWIATGGFVASKEEDEDGHYLTLMFRITETRGFNEEIENESDN